VHAAAGGAAELEPPGRIGDEVDQDLGDLVGVLGVAHELAVDAVADLLSDPAGLGADDGELLVHRLGDGQAEAFPQ